jgi:hypothetical protein
MAVCSVCRVDLAPAETLYNEHAAVICRSCLDTAEVKSLNARAASSASKAAYGNLFLGVFSLFFNPFWLLTLGSIGNGIYVFRQLEKDARSGEVPRDAGVRKVVAVVGAVIGVLSVPLHLLMAAHRARNGG